MRFDLSQQLKLEQRMKLAPRIIQAMEILQLPVLALQERIDAELQSNPVLEVQQPGVDEEATPVREEETLDRGEQAMVVDEDSGNSQDFERLAEFVDEYGAEFANSDAPMRRRSADTGERDRKMDAMANAPAAGISLNDYLMDQWKFIEVDELVKRTGKHLINNIDDDGFLRTPLEELIRTMSDAPETAVFARALKLVQSLDPPGVGARDIKECLLLQLAIEAEAGRDVSLEIELVTNFLRDIEMNRLPQIAKRTGKPLDAIKSALENLSHLNPRPGSVIGQRNVPIIVPDAIVDLDDSGQVVINMSDGNTPRLLISKAYQRMARDSKTAKDAKKFIMNNVRSAQWLMGAIDQRRQTVHRVIVEVFRKQKEFLESGQEALKPLPMADIANKVGVHVATVSRAVAGKHVQTPRGIFPLRMFFSGGTTTAEGDDVSWDAVKAKLKEVVDSEDKAKPLNDDQLAQELSKHGIDIARRTVAKYRKLLDIPPARKRRQY